MPRLSEYALKDLRFNEGKFKWWTGLDFSFVEFEDLAERYEQETPGQGYQRAYQQSLANLFKTALLDHMHGEKEMKSIATIIAAYDMHLIDGFDGYITKRQDENIPVNIKTNGEDFSLETLEALLDVLHQTPDIKLYDHIEEKFKSGEYVHSNMHEWTQRLKGLKMKISRPLARKITSCAEVLEKKNRDRHPILRFLLFPIHFMEKNMIKEMRELAVRDLKIEDFTENPKYLSKNITEEVKKDIIYKGLVKEVMSEFPDPFIINMQLSIEFKIKSIKAAQHKDGKETTESVNKDEMEMDLEKLHALDEEEFGKFFTDDELDNRKVNEFLNKPSNLEGDAPDKASKVSYSESFTKEMTDEIVALIGKEDIDYEDKRSWAESSVCKTMLRETERICKLYDEAKAKNAGAEEIEKIIENGANALYGLAYFNVNGFGAYARDDNGFAIEESPIVAQKLTDLFINKALSTKLSENELSKFKENYVIKNRDHAISVMQKYNADVPEDKCREIVDNAATELHAFEKVEFDKAVFENTPTEIESKKSEIGELTNDKQFAKN